jgi:hypothetical protein
VLTGLDVVGSTRGFGVPLVPEWTCRDAVGISKASRHMVGRANSPRPEPGESWSTPQILTGRWQETQPACSAKEDGRFRHSRGLRSASEVLSSPSNRCGAGGVGKRSVRAMV